MLKSSLTNLVFSCCFKTLVHFPCCLLVLFKTGTKHPYLNILYWNYSSFTILTFEFRYFKDNSMKNLTHNIKHAYNYIWNAKIK